MICRCQDKVVAGATECATHRRGMMNKRVAHTAELIATLRSEQSKSLASMRGMPTGETVTAPSHNGKRNSRPAKPRPITKRASTPSTSLYGGQHTTGANHKTLDVSRSHYELSKRHQRQQYKQNALMALIGGLILGLSITIL